MIKSLQSLAISALLLAVCNAAQAQNWPDRPVKFISSQAAAAAPT